MTDSPQLSLAKIKLEETTQSQTGTEEQKQKNKKKTEGKNKKVGRNQRCLL
jgi:hypothetical protein